MSLRTGTELSTLLLLLNKVSGLYGLLALLTGIHLSSLQLSMYLYSVVALILTALLAPHIRTQSPFHCLALATFFVVDTVVNAAYTAAFGITWFLMVSVHHSAKGGPKGFGEEMMDDAAGFTSAEYNVSKVDVIVGHERGSTEAVTAGSGFQRLTAAKPSLGHGVLQPESFESVIVIMMLWAVRVYLVLVVMSYARLVLRRYVAATSRNRPVFYERSKSGGVVEDSFAVGLPEGRGWQGCMGRWMISLAPGYWLGSEDGDDVWLHEEMAMGKMRRRDGAVETPGVVERERRKRGGTGMLRFPLLCYPSL